MLAGSLKPTPDQQVSLSNGNPDIADVIYVTSRLVHSPACLLAWSVSDSIPADAIAASERRWCPDLAPSPLARRWEMLTREWRNGPL